MNKEQVLFHLRRMRNEKAPRHDRMEKMAEKAVSYAQRRRILAHAKELPPEAVALELAIEIIEYGDICGYLDSFFAEKDREPREESGTS